MRLLCARGAGRLVTAQAHAFDLQGHRGARGLAPENTLAGFETALRIGVTTLELDLAMTKDGVLVVSHDRRLNPDHTRGPDGQFLAREGPPIRSLTFAEVQQYDVGRLKPGTDYAKSFPEQQPVDGARIPALTELFDLVKRAGADHVRFNIETKITPTSGAETPDPETFAAALAKAVRDAGLANARERAVVRLAHPDGDEAHRAGNRARVPDRRGADLRHDQARRARPVAMARRPRHRRLRRLGAAPRRARPAAPSGRRSTAMPSGDDIAAAKALGLKVIPWTVNERADMERLIALGVDGIITDYPDRLRAVMAEKNMPLPPQVNAP